MEVQPKRACSVVFVFVRFRLFRQVRFAHDLINGIVVHVRIYISSGFFTAIELRFFLLRVDSTQEFLILSQPM